MRKALLIGINYQNQPDISLEGCIGDVINMGNMLIDAYDYKIDDIVVLRDDTSDPTKNPTKKNIIAEFERLIENSADLEEIWFHYSGHGSLLKDIANKHLRNSEDTEMKNIIIPSDYVENGVIDDIELVALIQRIECRTIMIFDCCHSGTVCDLPWSFEYKSPTDFNMTKSNNIVFSNNSVYLYSGSKDSQTSMDTYNEYQKKKVGAFTTSFIKCLRESRHNASVLRLYRDICLDLEKNGFKQTPVFSSTNPSPNFVITKPHLSAKINLPIGYRQTKTSIVKNMTMMLHR